MACSHAHPSVGPGKPGLAALRRRLQGLECRGASRHGVLPLGVAAIDAALPGGGLARGAVHEACGFAAPGFAALLAGRVGGPVLWCVAGSGLSLYAPGLAAFGLSVGRLLVARPSSTRDLLWTMEEGLRTPALGLVVGELAKPVALTAGRRLQLAAEAGGAMGLMLCPGEAGNAGALSGGLAPSAAVSRWRVDGAPSSEERPGARLGLARWRLGLRHCRGAAAEKSWLVEWCDATGGLALVPEAGDRALVEAACAAG